MKIARAWRRKNKETCGLCYRHWANFCETYWFCILITEKKWNNAFDCKHGAPVTPISLLKDDGVRSSNYMPFQIRGPSGAYKPLKEMIKSVVQITCLFRFLVFFLLFAFLFTLVFLALHVERVRRKRNSKNDSEQRSSLMSLNTFYKLGQTIIINNFNINRKACNSSTAALSIGWCFEHSVKKRIESYYYRMEFCLSFLIL